METISRQVRRAEERQQAKIDRADRRVVARAEKRKTKGLQSLAHADRRGYPRIVEEPFQPTGRDYRFSEKKTWFGVRRKPQQMGVQEAARRRARMEGCANG